MPRASKPRSGSKQFWPRVKAEKMYANVRSWAKVNTTNLLGFAGYKVGMTHVSLLDNRPTSMTKGTTISWPVTVLECAPLKILSVRFYQKLGYGSGVLGEVLAGNLDKSLVRKISLPKNKDGLKKISDFESKLKDIINIKVLVYTQPKKTGVGKKTPEIFECALGGDITSGFNWIKENINKEFRLSDVLKTGTKVDLHLVTKGKGFQGLIKRFGTALRSHKSEKVRRSAVMGSVIPGKVLVGHNMAGRMGMHMRTEYNKDVVMIDSDVKKINPRGGFIHYGNVKSDYILVKGSVGGPAKRLVILTPTIRNKKGVGDAMQIQNISLESKQ